MMIMTTMMMMTMMTMTMTMTMMMITMLGIEETTHYNSRFG